MPSTSILCFGNDHILVETRQQIFQSAGFLSRRAETLEELQRCFRAAAVDLLVICHSTIIADREEAKRFAQSQAPPTLILVLHKGVQSVTDKAQTSFDSRLGPARMLAAVDTLLMNPDRHCQ